MTTTDYPTFADWYFALCDKEAALYRERKETGKLLLEHEVELDNEWAEFFRQYKGNLFRMWKAEIDAEYRSEFDIWPEWI